MERGDFKDLPGKGKPQQLDDNPYIPPAVRMANQMLKDNGFAPRWIEIDKGNLRRNREGGKINSKYQRTTGAFESQTPGATPKT